MIINDIPVILVSFYSVILERQEYTRRIYQSPSGQKFIRWEKGKAVDVEMNPMNEIIEGGDKLEELYQEMLLRKKYYV